MPAVLVTILIFMDQQITAVILNRKEYKLKVSGGQRTGRGCLGCQLWTGSTLLYPGTSWAAGDSVGPYHGQTPALLAGGDSPRVCHPPGQRLAPCESPPAPWCCHEPQLTPRPCPPSLQKGAGFHLDLLCVSLLMIVTSVTGLPWYVSATVISLAHMDSLRKESTTSAPGEQPEFLGIRYGLSSSPTAPHFWVAPLSLLPVAAAPGTRSSQQSWHQALGPLVSPWGSP